MKKHLWEIKHNYYCNEGNYFAAGNDQPTKHYKSWSDFMEEFGDCDFDYNLLFRWDWEECPDDEDDNYNGEEGGKKFNGDINYRNGVFKVFWMGQRKGLYQWTTIEVCRADESEIKKFLLPRWEHLKKLWEGIS